MELAVLSGPGFTSLPEDETTLRDRLECSRASFAGEVEPSEAWFTLMLEDASSGRVDGVAGVKAAVGVKRPFMSFRHVTFAHYSSAVNARVDHPALMLVNECKGWSEVGSLFLKADKRQGGAGRLLARSRYLLIAAAPERFSPWVLAELRGVFDAEGRSPFWDDVASKFFPMPFDDADEMSASTNGQFIFDLAPRHPIYVDLLPERARAAIGEVHPEGVPAKLLLEHEGFRETGLVDVFDAGPTVACPRDEIRTVQDSLRRRVKLAEPGDAPAALVSVDDVTRFRATRAPVATDETYAYLTYEVAELLRVGEGDLVRVKA
jgi:arginine N-succinyltransferase